MTGSGRGPLTIDARPPIPPREKLLLALLLGNVVWLMFALGGVRLWGEVPAAAVALLSLLLLPRWNNGELAGSRAPVYELLRLPLFWCGFALYILFFIHSWNIAWIWTIGAGGATMLVANEPLVSWLPTSLVTPLEENNPFRNMLFYSIPWLSACSAWAGLATRRSLSYLLNGIAILGTAFACIALWQYFNDYEKIFGIFETVRGRQGTDIPFWGSLINGNHAAYLLILINGLCMGLFLSGWHNDLQRFRSGGGAWVLFFAAALVVTFAILMAQSRGAIGVTILQWLLFLTFCSIFFFRRFGKRGALLPAAVIAVMAIITLSFIANPEVFENQKQEWDKTFSLVENPELEARYYMFLITRDMIADRPWQGHGAGSWRYLHFPYLAKYPEFRTTRSYWTRDPATRERIQRTRIVWFQNAHVDLAEYVVEWGWIGASLPLLAMLWLIYRTIRARSAVDLGMLCTLSGVALVWLGAAIEFHFRIPLVLLAWTLVFTAVVRLADRTARHS
jgi:hypothetical protein